MIVLPVSDNDFAVFEILTQNCSIWFYYYHFFPKSFTKERQHEHTAFIAWVCGCLCIIDSLMFLVIMCSIAHVELWISKFHFQAQS